MASKSLPERRKKIVPSRRRRDDDGDEESVMGDIEDDSLSDTSVISNGDDDADAEASDASLDEESLSPKSNQNKGLAGMTIEQSGPEKTKTAAANGTFKTSADTEAILNGLKTNKTNGNTKELHFDELGDEDAGVASPTADAKSSADTRQESFAERNRREHQEYLKQRDSNPAFVPNRGGFFLHDNRTLPSGPSNFRFPNRGRGRGPFNGAQSGRGAPINEPTERPWAHDLHEEVAKPEQRASVPTARNQVPKQNATASPSTGPNRSFSTSVVVGHVPVHIYLPGMSKKVSVPNVVRKQHTLLPQHRPPLRRDKPVRISLPEIAPRYIFPSVERSFIFIPRAMRPNQNFQRGRGRGSFHASRRTSVFGGSGYAASIAMSRRSSIGQTTPRDGVGSPAISVMSGNAVPDQRIGRPVVRMPVVPQQTTNGPPAMMQPINSVTRESSQQALPMHQPRPQKNVSLADIESPAAFTFNPIPQQEEQPFHQQFPNQVGSQPYVEGPHSRRPSFPHVEGRTPLNQIPDRAIFAQPFQPYPMYQPPGFYPPGPMFYPQMNPDGTLFNGAIPQQMLPTSFVSGAAPAMPVQIGPSSQVNDIATQANMVAHESNGMVYYYDPASLPGGSQSAPMPQYATIPAGGVLGMGGMITPPAQYYYPPGNGMYYTHQ
jgi:hypothetical protein